MNLGIGKVSLKHNPQSMKFKSGCATIRLQQRPSFSQKSCKSLKKTFMLTPTTRGDSNTRLSLSINNQPKRWKRRSGACAAYHQVSQFQSALSISYWVASPSTSIMNTDQQFLSPTKRKTLSRKNRRQKKFKR